MNGINSLVYDLDGTLVNSSPGIANSLEIAFAAVGRKLPSVNIRNVIGPPINIIARMIDPSLNDDEVRVIEREYRADYDVNGWRATVAFKGVLGGLQRQRNAGMRLFVVTNKPRIPTEHILINLGMDRFFEGVLTRDMRFPKYASKVEMLAELMMRYQFEPLSALMIGDTREDQEAAQANGIRFIYMTYGYGCVPEAILRAGTFRAIEEILQQRETKS